MSHLLKEFRGKVDLIYIDPPFDSKADYKKKIKVKGKEVKNDSTTFEEKQYGDIWANDDYLQFMYERLILLRELLSDTGSIYLHCDWHKSHHLRCLMDEVFGNGGSDGKTEGFKNEIVWGYRTGGTSKNTFARKHDTIFLYSKKSDYLFNVQYYKSWQEKKYNFNAKYPEIWDEEKKKWYHNAICRDVWEDLNVIGTEADGSESEGYPTQKPEALLERIIKASSNPGDLVFDCFMGSGTTQAVAMKLGRRFIGADINLGAIQTTTKRLLNIQKELESNFTTKGQNYTGFEVYNVNNYDLFRNELEAKDIILDALSVERFDKGSIYDGSLDGYMVKMMPINHIATKADLEGFRAQLPYKTFDKRKEEHPNSFVEKIMLICMGHEPDLAAAFAEENLKYKLDIKICDILTDKKDLQFKRESEADIKVNKNKLIIKNFYPLNLLQKLSMDKEKVNDYKQLVESVFIDFNYDGKVLKPDITDIPEKDEFVRGEYDIPEKHGKIKVKITDLLSESLEVEI